MSCIDQSTAVTIGIISFLVGTIVPPLFGYCIRKIPPPYIEETDQLLNA